MEFCLSGGYSATHPVIQIFWEVVEGFTDEEKRKLLKFVTSCSRPPLLGFKVRVKQTFLLCFIRLRGTSIFYHWQVFQAQQKGVIPLNGLVMKKQTDNSPQNDHFQIRRR